MITFKIFILVSFSLATKPKSKDRKNHTKITSSDKPKSQKKKFRISENKSSNKVPVETPELPKHVIVVDEPVGVLHVEYEILPKRFKYKFDVICWGPVAKIFATDGVKALKTIIQDERAWVPVYIEHYLETFSLDEVVDFRRHVLEFVFNNNPNTLDALAKNDKSKIFYIHKDEIDLNDFINVYTEDPNSEFGKTAEELKLEEYIKDILMECVNHPNTYNVVSYLKYNERYKDNFLKIIDRVHNGEEVECRDFVNICPESFGEEKLEDLVDDSYQKNLNESKGKDKKTKNKSKDKKKDGKKSVRGEKEESFSIKIPAEIFFTDPILSTYKMQVDHVQIKNCFVTVSSENLLTYSQKFYLNPIVIKIKKISNLPYDILSKAGFKNIFAFYNIPFVATCKTIEKPIKKLVKFNESHIFFTDCTPQIKLMEFLQTRKLIVELYGIREVTDESDLKPSLFGSATDDFLISKIQNNIFIPYLTSDEKNRSTIVKLAVSTYDISQLTYTYWLFKEKGQCHMPNLTLYQKCVGTLRTPDFIDVLTVNELNLPQISHISLNPLSEALLISCGTTLKVEVNLLLPQAATLVMNTALNTYKKIFLVVFSKTLASEILNNVLLHNEKQTKSGTHDLLTGFMLDNGDDFAIFLEGSSDGFILNIRHLAEKCDLKNAKVFLNSDFAFEMRLYEAFIEFGGLYTVTLKIPLKKILSDRKLYLKGNVPLPCLEALMKLDMLFQSPNLKSMLQYNLFPNPEELISLNIEWGVPLRWATTTTEVSSPQRKEVELIVEDTIHFKSIPSLYSLYPV